MKKKILNELKEKLEKEKAQIEEELEKFAKRDIKLPEDWDTRFPKWNGTASGGGALETAADEVEEYEAKLPVEYSLEMRLKNINLALKKIKEGKYGICEKCGKEIDEKRLKIVPEARFCLKCEK